ncbi:class I SAM-dependent methyltransferase [Mycolicibacterium sp. XJ662]
MPTLDWNRQTWGQEHDWARHGDEWDDLASYCRRPYAMWKDALVETFMAPYVVDADVVEIAPGYGRWSEYMAESARSIVLVDINENCLNACRQRFGHFDNFDYQLGDGTSLPVADSSVDFVWSFDSFVHMDPDVVRSYVFEIGRVLRPGGSAIVHHADKRPRSLTLTPLTSRLGTVGRVVQQIASQGRLRDDGNRSNVTGQMVADWAASAGLTVAQTDSWGDSGKYNVRKYRDLLSVLHKPLI